MNNQHYNAGSHATVYIVRITGAKAGSAAAPIALINKEKTTVFAALVASHQH